MIALDDRTRGYWQYQYDVVKLHLVPLLEHWGLHLDGARVLDVGCNTAGGTCAMHDAGAACKGFDLYPEFIEAGKALQGNRNIALFSGDMYKEAIPFAGERFDLVMLHDVFEHLYNKDEMLGKLAEYLAPGGKLLITFPPYFSPYGAHQQNLRTSFARIPFFHLLPFAISYILPRLKDEDPIIVNEIQKLAELKMGIAGFEAIITRNHFHVDQREAYLIGPNHIRFGLKPIPAGPIADIPLLREFIVTGVIYLLSKGDR